MPKMRKVSVEMLGILDNDYHPHLTLSTACVGTWYGGEDRLQLLCHIDAATTSQQASWI